MSHYERIQYDVYREQGIVQGSGAVESAIRRVIHQRIKGCGKFWKEENVRVMRMWRGYLKSRRLDELMQWSRRFRARWWSGAEQRRAQRMVREAA